MAKKLFAIIDLFYTEKQSQIISIFIIRRDLNLIWIQFRHGRNRNESLNLSLGCTKLFSYTTFCQLSTPDGGVVYVLVSPVELEIVRSNPAGGTGWKFLDIEKLRSNYKNKFASI
jgi:hypothetical protein